jgi:hypothetical protein
MRLARNRFLKAGFILICLTRTAMAQNEKPAENTMGNITNNQGIITQGQVGNNTIVNPVHRDANGVYQGNTKVGSAPPPVIDQATGTAMFPAMSFTSYPDPSQPLEYGDLLLSSEGAPRPRPNTFVGSLSVMIGGFQAKVLGKRTP